MEKIGTAFRTAHRFATDNKIPVVRFAKDDRKIDVIRPYLARQARTGRSGVAAIGTAQEFQNVFASAQRTGATGFPWFSFFEGRPAGHVFLFLSVGRRFRAGFHQNLHLLPYPIKVWLNGHERAKRQATKAGIGFAERSNGFVTGTDRQGLQDVLAGWAGHDHGVLKTDGEPPTHSAP